MPTTSTMRKRKLRKQENQSIERKNESDARHQERSSSLFNFSFLFKVVVVVVTSNLIYCYVTSPVRPVAIEKLSEKIPFVGEYEVNDILHNGRRLLDTGEYAGPECIAFDDEENIYTGLDDGRVIKIGKDENGNVGEGKVDELAIENCGFQSKRPLGMRYSHGNLYVADPIAGVFKLNLASGSCEIVVSSQDFTPPSTFVNDLTITKDGKTVYVSSTSNMYNISQGLMQNLVGNCTGSVVKVDLKTKKVEQFQSNLCSANGMQLSQDEQVLLVGELAHYQVLMFDVQTKKVIKIINFPMMPDNIRLARDGGYFVALPLPRSFFNDMLYSLPFLRRLLGGMIREEWQKTLLTHMAKPTGLVKLDVSGNVVKFLTDSNGSVAQMVTHAIEDKAGNLYLGSYLAPFIVKLDKKFL